MITFASIISSIIGVLTCCILLLLTVLGTIAVIAVIKDNALK